MLEWLCQCLWILFTLGLHCLLSYRISCMRILSGIVIELFGRKKKEKKKFQKVNQKLVFHVSHTLPHIHSRTGEKFSTNKKKKHSFLFTLIFRIIFPSTSSFSSFSSAPSPSPFSTWYFVVVVAVVLFRIMLHAATFLACYLVDSVDNGSLNFFIFFSFSSFSLYFDKKFVSPSFFF